MPTQLPNRKPAQTQNARAGFSTVHLVIALLALAVLVGMLVRLDVSFASDDGTTQQDAPSGSDSFSTTGLSP
jgi:hypothetical protein